LSLQLKEKFFKFFYCNKTFWIEINKLYLFNQKEKTLFFLNLFKNINTKDQINFWYNFFWEEINILDRETVFLKLNLLTEQKQLIFWQNYFWNLILYILKEGLIKLEKIKLSKYDKTGLIQFKRLDNLDKFFIKKKYQYIFRYLL
jgi:hypothetical protein